MLACSRAPSQAHVQQLEHQLSEITSQTVQLQSHHEGMKKENARYITLNLELGPTLATQQQEHKQLQQTHQSLTQQLAATRIECGHLEKEVADLRLEMQEQRKRQDEQLQQVADKHASIEKIEKELADENEKLRQLQAHTAQEQEAQVTQPHVCV